MTDTPLAQKPANTSPPMPDHAAAPPAAAALNSHARRRSLFLGVGLAVALVAAAGYFLVPDLYEASTDDAYVEAHLVSMIPKVPAYVLTLHVDDNSEVKAGDLLIELDPRDYAVQVDLAQANVGAARSKVDEAQAQIVLANAGVYQAEAEVRVVQASAALAATNLHRLSSVADIRGVSTDRIDAATSAVESNTASLAAVKARQQAAMAQSMLAAAQEKTARATLEQAQAQLAQAQLNLSYTKIYAPQSGSIASKSVEQGNYVQPGQLLLSLVPNTVFVVANYKETQLTRVRPGQKVDVFVDAFPKVRLHGHVDSLQRGTGSRFALLPPENATGNFVKVVQRVPVKIVLDQPREALQWISPGMSVETEIYFARRPAWLGFDP
jgi:membrane fusion protein (multidrug efflux system)